MSTRALPERLYQHYVAFGDLPDVDDARRQLAHRAPYLRRLIKLAMPESRDVRVLDVGCGHGAFLLALRAAGYRHLEGVDSAAQQVELAHRLGLDCVRQDNALDVMRGMPPGVCDVVVAFDVVEHLSKDEALAFADEAYRILRPRGRLVAHVPNGEAIFGVAVYFGDFTHEIAFTRRSLRQLLGVAGFGHVDVFEDSPPVHGMRSALRHVAWRAARGVFRLIYVAETGDASLDLVLSQNLLAVAVKGGLP
jgi:SAM-dependent methyltransferase